MGSSHDIKEEYLNFTKTLHAANLALCTKEKYKENSALVKKLAFGMSAAYFWLHSEKASKETQLFFAKPNNKIVFEVFCFFYHKEIINLKYTVLEFERYFSLCSKFLEIHQSFC